MHNYVLSTSALVLGLLAGSSQAYWRLSCSTIQTSRIDPIINPNALSPHAHIIAGEFAKFRTCIQDRMGLGVFHNQLTDEQVLQTSIKHPPMILFSSPTVPLVRFKTTSPPTGLRCCITNTRMGRSKRSPTEA